MKKLFKICLSILMCLSIVGCTTKKDNVLSITANDTYDKEETLTSVSVSADNVILKNKTIEGDLSVNADNAGSLALSNVTVKGKIVVDGGSDYTLNLFDVNANELDITGSNVRLVAMGSTHVNSVKTDNSITMVEQNITNEGFDDLNIKSGQLSEIVLITSGLKAINISNTALTSIVTDDNSLVEVLTCDSSTEIYGGAVIQTLQANASVKYEKEPENVVLGTNGVINGSSKEEATTTTSTSKKPVITSKKPVTTTKKPVTTTTTTKVTTQPIITSVTTTTTSSNNTAPVITVTDARINIGDAFSPLTGVTIYDKEDGAIVVTNTHIKSNNVNTRKIGTYYVEYFYTDKGGLSTTKSRKVIVEDNYEPVYVELDKGGDPVLYWERDTDAVGYSILLGTTEIATAGKRDTSYDIDLTSETIKKLLPLGKSGVFTVKAEYGDSSKPGKIGSATFTYEDNEEDYHVTWRVDEEQEIFIKASPIGKAEGNYTIEFDLSCVEDVTMGGIKLMDGVVTDVRGKAIVSYNLGEGITLKPTFTEPGVYTLGYRIKHSKDGLVLGSEIELNVRGTTNSGGSASSIVKPSIVNYGVDSWQTVYGSEKGTGVSVVFKLSDDLDLSVSTNKLRIKFGYYLKGTSDVEKYVTFTDKSFAFDTILKAGKEYTTEFSSYTVSSALATEIYEGLRGSKVDGSYDNPGTYIVSVEIIVTVKGEEYSTFKTNIKLDSY